MNSDRSTELQRLLDLLRQGDSEAGPELVGRAYERLRFLARRMLHRDFPRFDGRRGTDSVLHEATVRLLRSLKEVRPPTCRSFFNFAATQIRRVLLDAVRRGDHGEVVGLAEWTGGGWGRRLPRRAGRRRRPGRVGGVD
jgi:RNA polymerase sigma-70 factor (ECF subfamily)